MFRYAGTRSLPTDSAALPPKAAIQPGDFFGLFCYIENPFTMGIFLPRPNAFLDTLNTGGA